MLAGKVFAYDVAENKDIPLYFFCKSEPGPWLDKDGKVVSEDSTVSKSRVINQHVTMLFQPPFKDILSDNSGPVYRFALYSDGGAGTLDGRRAERVELTDKRFFQRLYATQNSLAIGYGERRSDEGQPNQAWSKVLVYDGPTFGRAFRFFVKRCYEIAQPPDSPQPPPLTSP